MRSANGSNNSFITCRSRAEENFFQKLVGQGQNMTATLMLTIFRLSHKGLGQVGTVGHGTKFRVGDLSRKNGLKPAL